ncbi:MAG: HAD family phosphatase [Clostridiales bacterium]|nr:HAD family phosphatase [Clostridiales bacterium]
MIELPKLAIFDMDGLMFDTERLFMERKHEILRQLGYPAREEDYVKTIGLSGVLLREKLLEIYGSAYPAEEITRRTRAAVDAYVETYGPDVKPGIEDLLQWFRNQGVLCCVASSTVHAYVEKFLRLSKLDRYFRCGQQPAVCDADQRCGDMPVLTGEAASADLQKGFGKDVLCVVGGDEVARSKPQPDIFLTACARMGVKPEDALVLEDSENGVRAACAAHIPVICIPDLKQPSPEMAEMAVAVLPSAREVISLFPNPK